jgi:NitT/TauT family transport system permease protein
MRWLREALRGLPAYLWSGWGAVASLCLLLAAWEAAALRLGPLILPGPGDAFAALAALIARGQAWPELAISAQRALAGLGAALVVGAALGLLAGRFLTTAVIARPLLTLMLGMPPIAWLVLAMLWFGSGHATPVFTVFIATVPIVFAGALQGMRTLDAQYRELAQAFRLRWPQRLSDIVLPHVAAHLFPAAITALGTAWKVVVMAELLVTVDGVGAALASARTQLDTAATLAWISALLALLLAVEYGVLEPVRREVERWREAPG